MRMPALFFIATLPLLVLGCGSKDDTGDSGTTTTGTGTGATGTGTGATGTGTGATGTGTGATGTGTGATGTGTGATGTGTGATGTGTGMMSGTGTGMMSGTGTGMMSGTGTGMMSGTGTGMMSGTGTGSTLPPPTWTNDVQPILARTCAGGCHGDYGYCTTGICWLVDYYVVTGPVTNAECQANNYNTVADCIPYRIENGQMPYPNGCLPDQPGCITTAELNIVKRWIATGLQE